MPALTKEQVLAGITELAPKIANELDGQLQCVVENVLCYFLVSALKASGVSRDGMYAMLDYHWEQEQNPVQSQMLLPN